MATFFDESFWWDALSKPDWYMLIADDFRRLEKLAQHETDEQRRKQIKHEVYGVVERALRERRIPLATNGTNFDQERKPVTVAIIHHTKNQSGMTLQRLNAMQLLRIYGMYYANPNEAERYLKGTPVWSGHFYEGDPVFWGYHWLIRADGTAQQILQDDYIGWHAGNWEVNTKSVGICIDDDLSNKKPSQNVAESIARLIRTYYPQMEAGHLLGHREVNDKTECPGSLFLPIWKAEVQGLLI